MVGVCQACSLEASSFATAPVRSSLASGVSPSLFHLFFACVALVLEGLLESEVHFSPVSLAPPVQAPG